MRRGKLLTVRLNAIEMEHLKRLAAKDCLHVSEYVRNIIRDNTRQRKQKMKTKDYDYSVAFGENVVTCRYWPGEHFAEDINFDQVDPDTLYVADGDKFITLTEKVSRLAFEHYLEDTQRQESYEDGLAEAAAEARRGE